MKTSDRFREALSYAARLHAGQARKISGVPYVAHLLGTAALALSYGADEDEAIAALLHDAVEDQGGDATRREIARRFGPGVAEIVKGCTDTDQAPKPPWRERKEKHLARLHGATSSVRLVTACDKLDNARSILADYRRHGDSIWGNFRGGREGTLWYLRSVVEILQDAGPDALLEELDWVVSRLERAVEDGRDGGAAKNSS